MTFITLIKNPFATGATRSCGQELRGACGGLLPPLSPASASVNKGFGPGSLCVRSPRVLRPGFPPQDVLSVAVSGLRSITDLERGERLRNTPRTLWALWAQRALEATHSLAKSGGLGLALEWGLRNTEERESVLGAS